MRIKNSIGIVLFLGMLGFAVSWLASSCRPCNCDFEPSPPRKFFVEALGFESFYKVASPIADWPRLSQINELDTIADTTAILTRYAFERHYVAHQATGHTHPGFNGLFINAAFACDCNAFVYSDMALDSVKVQVYSMYPIGKNIKPEDDITSQVEVFEDVSSFHSAFFMNRTQPTKAGWLPAGLINIRFLDSRLIRDNVKDSTSLFQLKIITTLKSGRRDTALSSKLLIRPL